MLQYPSLLTSLRPGRCVVILGNKMAQTPSLDDKKLRKDFQVRVVPPGNGWSRLNFGS